MITCGAAHPALFIEHEQIAPFLDEPTYDKLRVLSGYGTALATLMSATTDHFGLLPVKEVPVKNILATATVILFTAPGDLRILYTDDPIVIAAKQWLRVQNISMVVTPQAFAYISNRMRGVQTLTHLLRDVACWKGDVKHKRIVPTSAITCELAEIATALKQTLQMNN